MRVCCASMTRSASISWITLMIAAYRSSSIPSVKGAATAFMRLQWHGPSLSPRSRTCFIGEAWMSDVDVDWTVSESWNDAYHRGFLAIRDGELHAAARRPIE